MRWVQCNAVVALLVNDYACTILELGGLVSQPSDIMEIPIYGVSEAAQYLRVPLNTLRYWTRDETSVGPLVRLAGKDPPPLSFHNLLEYHIINNMGAGFDRRLPQNAKAPKALAQNTHPPHPFLDQTCPTHRTALF